MLVKVFSLKFDPWTGGFDDDPVQSFIQDKEVLHIRDHLLVRNDIPYLVLVIKYYPFRKEAQEKTSTMKTEDWKKEIGDAEKPLFNRLRDWRSERCKKDGVPPYLIFNNAQLAAIVKKRPQSLSALSQVEGLGRGKLEKYGADVLAITQREAPESDSPPEKGTEGKEEKPNG